MNLTHLMLKHQSQGNKRGYGRSGNSYLSGSRVWFKVVSENSQPGAAMTDVVFTPVAPEGTLKRRTLEIKNRFTT